MSSADQDAIWRIRILDLGPYRRDRAPQPFSELPMVELPVREDTVLQDALVAAGRAAADRLQERT